MKLGRYIFVIFFLLTFVNEIGGQVLGNSLYNWDFGQGLPTGWQNSGQSALARFEYRGPDTTPNNTVCSRGSCGSGTVPPFSQTLSNGFMIFDSNYWDDNDNQCGGLGTGQDPAPHNAWMITNSFDLTGISSVYLTYQQQLRSYSASVKVFVSNNNGNTWNEITSLTQSGVINSPNVQWKSANISSWAGNQSNVKLKFQFQGTYYHWCLDDISIFVPSFNNLELSNAQFTNFSELSNPFDNPMYDVYPSFMPPNVYPNAQITNLGSINQTNVVLHTQVNNITTSTNVATNASSGITLNGGESININTNAVNIGPATADYEVSFQVTQTETDENFSNNIDTLDFSVHPYRLQYDEGVTENLYNVRSLENNSIAQAGTLYFLPNNNNKKIFSIEVCIGSGTLPGTEIKGYLYIPTMDSILAETETYIVNLADINNIGDQKMITLPLLSPFTLSNANLTFPDIVIDSTTMETISNPFQNVVAAMIEVTDNSAPFFIARSGKAAAGTTYLHYPSTLDLYYLLKIPMVRLKIFNSAAQPGCTDPLAMNYDPTHTIDDGSCDYPGCTQEQYDNFDPQANWDDGSCGYEGCMDPTADNYNPIATIMVPCEWWGCTDPSSTNFDPIANTDDGSCIYLGCTDSTAANYNPIANQDNGSCIYPGCTNPIASNYNAMANQDDGSCVILGCNNPVADNYNPSATQDDGSCIISGCTNPIADNYDATANLDNGTCYFLGCMDNAAFNFDATATVDDGSCIYTGCTDPNADNFDANADIDDGSCFYLGCTNISADNYDSTATVDDGSCYFLGCTDAAADNFDPSATVDDNSCLYYGCTDNTALNFDATANFNDGSCVFLVASLFAAQTSGCAPFTINAINQTLVYPASTCEFIISNGDTINGCSPTLTYTFNTPGTYSITYNYFYDGYLSSFTLNNIQVHALPQTPIISANPNTGMVSMTNNSPGLSYVWQLNGNNILPANNNPNFNNQSNNYFLNGNFSLTVTNANNCSSTSTNLLVIQPNFSIADNTICENDIAQINLSPIAVSGTTCQIDWGDGTITSGNSNTHVYSSAGNYSIIVSCTKNGYTGVLSKSITVYALPEIPVLGYTTGNIGVMNIQSGIAYTWYEDNALMNGIAGSSYNNFIGNQYNNGLFNVTATNSNNCVSSSLPLLVVQPYFTNPVDSSCTSYSAIATNLSEIIAGMTCQWNLNGVVSSTAMAQLDFINAGWYNIDLSCAVGATEMSYSDSIWIDPSPNVPILGYSTLGYVNCTNFNSSENYNWRYNADLLAGSTGSSISIWDGSQYASGWYSVESTNAFGCSTSSDSLYVFQPYFELNNASNCAADTATVFILNSLNESYSCQTIWGDGTFDLSDNTVNSIDHTYNNNGDFTITLYCQNPFGSGYFSDSYTAYPSPPQPLLQTLVPNVSCINCTSGLSYDWSYWSNPLPSATSSTNIDTGTNYANGPYQLNVVNSWGCTSSSDTLWSIVPEFSITPTEACPNTPIVLNNNTDGMDWLQCQISWGDGFGEVISSPSTTHIYDAGYNGEVLVTCYYDLYQGESSSWINIHALPTPILEEINEIVYITNFDPSWQSHWIIDSIPQPVYDNLGNLSGNLGVTYQVTTINSFGCSDSSSIVTNYIAPFVQEFSPMEVQVYPNPSVDYLMIETNHYPAQLEIWDAQGKWIQSQKINSNQTRVDLTDFSNGLFNFTLRTETEIFSAQFMVSR
jgi:hypothetical protein